MLCLMAALSTEHNYMRYVLMDLGAHCVLMPSGSFDELKSTVVKLKTATWRKYTKNRPTQTTQAIYIFTKNVQCIYHGCSK